MTHNSDSKIVIDKLADIDASEESWNIRVQVVMIWKQTYKNKPYMSTSKMTHNSDSEIVINKLADIDASKESWNIRVQVVMIWKQTYKNNPNMVSNLDMILIDQESTSEIAHNSDSEIVIDKLADIDASKESCNIRVQVVMIWKHTYKNNPNMVSRFDIILMDQEVTRIHATTKKNLINAFQALLEGAIRQITNFGMARNEGDYINFDTRVAFDFIGQVVSTEPMRVIKENARETRLMSIVAQDLSRRKMQVALWDGFALKLNNYISEHQNENSLVIILLRMVKLKTWGATSRIADIDLNVESSINTTQLNTETVVAKPEDYYLRFQIKNIDDILDYNEDQGRQKIPDEFNTMLNRKFVFKVQISKFNLENNYHAYTVHKMADDELVVGAVFNIHLHTKKTIFILMEKSVSVEGDNINVVDLDAVTPTTTSLKRPIEIITTTESFEWSSSKDGVAPHTLKIPKMEKLE
ncbi:unnamed protein product [Lactuca virosa]|uniref:Replication protein A 70 kDa DNA-binding subunit B/D first OB fold domain-containing protein n=1 Tax=Lactuca virosa TaxID=75947 RepID=A0AAU9N648_9ASTR|nr:unnamed protein product [Lactuca virosa]